MIRRSFFQTRVAGTCSPGPSWGHPVPIVQRHAQIPIPTMHFHGFTSRTSNISGPPQAANPARPCPAQTPPLAVGPLLSHKFLYLYTSRGSEPSSTGFFARLVLIRIQSIFSITSAPIWRPGMVF